MRTCSCCGATATVLLKAGANCPSQEPTIVCTRCDFVAGWPTTKTALRRNRR